MKYYKLIIPVLLLLFFSCTKEDMEVTSETEKLSAVNYTVRGSDGVKYRAGFGFTPSIDRLHEPAYDNIELRESYNYGRAPVTVSYKVIRSDSDIESFVRDVIRVNAGFLGIFKYKKTIKDLRGKIRTKNNRVNIIARAAFNDYQYNVSNTDKLVYNDRAKQLLDNEQFSQFFNLYGASYVSKQVFGGEIYFLYSYESSAITKETKGKYNKLAADRIETLFNLESTYGFPQEEKSLLENTTEIFKSWTNIGDFAPAFIKSEAEFNTEVQRVRTHLNRNPDQAAGVYQFLEPYRYPGKNPRLSEAFRNEQRCFNNIDRWAKLRDDLLKAQDNDVLAQLFQGNYDNALTYVENNLNRSQQCQGTVSPLTLSSLKTRYGIRDSGTINIKLGGNSNFSWVKRGSYYTIGTSFGTSERMQLVYDKITKTVRFNWAPIGDTRFFGPIRNQPQVYGGHSINDPDTYFILEHLQGDEYAVKSRPRGTYLRPPSTAGGEWRCDARRGEAIVRIVKN
ncbi:hypothetical protein [Maribacter sp. 2-571]|uniref:hypothetical protein n=1 Tax=Maribacter sp. 2-571 TaxID=3417569 RepID=UPI003D3483E2